MKYISTRGGIEPVGFQEAVMMGLARDGGLMIPRSIPQVAGRLDQWRKLDYVELAVEVMALFADLDRVELDRLVRRSYASFASPEVAPVVRVGPVHIVELFHGPTLAFKDVALQLLGNLFELILRRTGGALNILAATSGDTGSAAIHGIRSRDHMRIVVLHPAGRVSPLQERQMTTVLDANVHNLALAGSFDDCQAIVKTLFNDLEFRDRHALGSVNSINWARVLAQMVYYFYATFRVQAATGATRVRFAVPTGNFGDIFAGYLAARMGLPIAKLVLATNENDILSRFFATGQYRKGPVCQTLSPSMDIQVASNFERYLYYRGGESADQVNRWMVQFATQGSVTVPVSASAQGVDGLIVGGRGTTEETLEVIRRYQAREGYLMDPHTAVGVRVGEAHLHPDEPMICLATAHPAKFSEAIARALGCDVAHHPILDALKDLPTRKECLPADVGAVRAALVKILI